ncbi:peptidoglycan-binding protein [Actinokineospora bangkokensis]|uniref:Peptidoglycan-binding protein n=1 Tax=Actinokineospora bangkokensis TaxID=1193682 RepID=A0A1Q9LJ63_9PSEU|nr:peptidoglycan-binding protein [Actinokineospora bangkokensis]OLR92019.1 peptidoglycan-binding protein [Actinokineospora bangkokensis]
MAVAASVAAPATGSATATALPAVNMAAVVKAAQIDPRRPDTALTPGAAASVLQVEKALDAKGFLDPSYVDGHFGTRTVDAYAAFQRSLGFSGLDASGLPGRSSLTSLGTNRFTVTAVISPGSKIAFRGVTVNTRTKAMLVAAEGLLGRTLTLTQGSYNPGGDSTSAGTHDGGGVLDISVTGLTTATRTDVVRRLRQVGFAAWLRTPSQGDWPYHIHAVAISDTDQSPQAQHQAGDYYLGQNGLANRGPDDGPQVTKVTWEEYQA